VAQVIAGAEEQGDAVPAFTPPEMQAAWRPRELPVDELIDCNIPSPWTTAARRKAAAHAAAAPCRQQAGALHRPHHRRVWEAIAHGSIYDALLAGAQLANRSNAINEIEYSELVMRLRDLTDALSGEPDCRTCPMSSAPPRRCTSSSSTMMRNCR
jgi:hypothetical protein